MVEKISTLTTQIVGGEAKNIIKEVDEQQKTIKKQNARIEKLLE